MTTDKLRNELDAILDQFQEINQEKGIYLAKQVAIRRIGQAIQNSLLGVEDKAAEVSRRE